MITISGEIIIIIIISYNFQLSIRVSDWLIFCCENMILHQKRNKNDKNECAKLRVSRAFVPYVPNFTCLTCINFFKCLQFLTCLISTFTFLKNVEQPITNRKKLEWTRTRNATRCNNRDDLLHHSFTLKVSKFSEAYI